MFRMVITAFTGLFLAVAPTSAQEIYVVHGVPGDDLGLPTELAVDVQLNGACTGLAPFEFGGVAGPIPVDAGTSEVAISLNDGNDDCNGTLVATQRIDVAVFETAIVVAHLDQNGAVRLSKFTADTSELLPGQTRTAFVHAAKAPGVNIRVGGGGKSGARIRNLQNGEQTFAAILDEGTYNVRVVPSGFGAVTLTGVALAGNTVIIAVGSLDQGTFQVIPVEIQ
jgi:hypothetical protein